MLLCIVYGIFFVHTVDMKINACNVLNAMFVDTVNTLVFVALTQHLIQSTMRCENSTLICIKWPLALIFNQFSIRKKFWKDETVGFSTIPSILYMSILLNRTRISNAFNAIYVDTIDTKHIHMFLPVTFLIFN